MLGEVTNSSDGKELHNKMIACAIPNKNHHMALPLGRPLDTRKKTDKGSFPGKYSVALGDQQACIFAIDSLWYHFFPSVEMVIQTCSFRKLTAKMKTKICTCLFVSFLKSQMYVSRKAPEVTKR